MDTVGTGVRCPSCGAAATSRFCGHCGALVQARAPAAQDAAPGAGVPLHEPRAPEQPEGSAPEAPAPRSRTRTAVVLAVVLVGAAVTGVLVRPAPEVVTADGMAGPDGTGRTSTRAVTELAPRWDVAWDGSPAQPASVTALHDLGDVLVLATTTELIGLTHPTALPRVRGQGLQRPVDAVLWRSPAIVGTPRPVEGRLPVLAGSELLWVSGATGAVEARHDLGDAGPWSPAFAVPAGDLLVSPDGATALTREGAVRWRGDVADEVVGVAGDVVVVRHDRTVAGRDLATGAERWRAVVASQGLVTAALVEGVLVTTRMGGRVALRDPATGEQVDALRVGPAPAAGPSWDGEAAIVGTAGTDVFVRVDPAVGIRYSRISLDGTGRIQDLVELANEDLLAISEHAGYLVTVGWDTVEVRRGGDVAWTAVELEHPPATDGNWLVLSSGPFGVVGVDGSRTRIRLEPLGTELREGRPAVLDGRAVVGTPLGVEAVDLDTGRSAWSRPLGTWGCCPSLLAGDGAVVLTGPVRVLDADGARRWDDATPDPTHGAPGAVAIADPWVVAVEHAGWTPGSARLLRLADGRPGPELPTGTLTGAVVRADRLFALDVEPGGSPTLVAFDLPPTTTTATTLPPRWTRPVAHGTHLVLAGDELLAVGAAAVDHLDPRSGELLRRTALPTLGTGPVAYADGRLVRRVDASTLEAVALASGERWTRSFPGPLTAAPTIAGDLVYVATGGSGGRSAVSALALGTGEPVASVEVDAPAVTSLTVAGGVVLAGGPDRLHAFGPPLAPGTPDRSAGR